MPDAKSSSPPTHADTANATPPTTEVYAVHGVEPEVQAYAMAKYSRSSLSMKESLREINEQKAEKFLNTFYFQYGHRSIADLAHIALAIEKLSLLAAIAVVDEQRWDGQERSTRYQDFKKGLYYVPDFGGDAQLEQSYRDAAGTLFVEYEVLSEGMWRHLADRTPRPPDMKPEAYERTLRARAFDISRYLLPLATNTSLGQIVNARTLESQVARLLSSDYEEIRRLGEALKRAANEPAYNVSHDKLRMFVEELKGYDEGLGREAYEMLLRPVRVAPTLVKYADASAYEMQARTELRAAAAELMGPVAIQAAPAVELLADDSVEIELAATLLYPYCHHPYRQVRECVEAMGEKRRAEIIALGLKHRSRHDELPRTFAAGQAFRFDILMDIGGFRDMHRHRRCIQIGQEFTTAHGFDTPDEVVAAGVKERYERVMRATADACAAIEGRLQKAGDKECAEKSRYLIPLAYRKRTLFKMDLAEAVYISELRTTPAGHVSYRRVAYAMYEEVVRRHPALAPCFRVYDIHEPVDLLKR